MKNNKLIAEFMGIDYVNVDAYQLPYNKDWNWLMPVHKKCMFTPNFQGDDELRTYLIDAVVDADMDRLYDAVVEFINEYNND